LILKGRKFHYAEEQHVNFIKGKELDQKSAVTAMKKWGWYSLLRRR